MNVRPEFELPQEKQDVRRQAIHLEQITLVIISINVVVLFFLLGNSQTMRTAWMEDIISLVPPLAFLVAIHFETKAPSEKNPYGYFRAVNIAYLCSSLALLVFGGLLLYEGVHTLVARKHPAVATIQIFGEQIWLGWLMILALICSSIAMMILGRLKLHMARQLHDKVLYADADMNKADWLTGIAGSIGVGGIGLGYWWLDAVAAIIISLDIIWDGIRNTKRVCEDLLDSIPREVDSDRAEPLPEKIRELLLGMDWIADVKVRLREEGHVFTGEVMIVPSILDQAEELMLQLENVRRQILKLDWRLYDFSVMPILPDNYKHEDSGKIQIKAK